MIDTHNAVHSKPPWMTWFAVDFDGRPWPVIAASLFAVQVALFAASRAVDLLVVPETGYGFLAAMLLFAGLVFADALSVGLGTKEAVAWASVVTLGWIVGAVPYARRRQHLRRGDAR